MSSETTPVSEDGRIVENNFDTLPTHVPGLRILVDHGEDAQDLTRGATVELRDMATPYVERAEAIKDLTQLQKVPHDRFVEIGEQLPGIRGVRDMESGVEVQINPRAENVFDEAAIRRSLGERAKEVLHRKVTVTVELDPEKDNVNGFVRSMERRLQRQGSKAEVKTTESTRADEKALWDMIKDDDVALASGAWEVRTVGYSIVPRKIASDRDLAATEEEVLRQHEQSEL